MEDADFIPNKERFFESFAHTTHRVMGRKMGKFTLYRRFWLEALRSPLVVGGEITAIDLELASRVCSAPYGKVHEVIEHGVGRWFNFSGWLFALKCFCVNLEKEGQKWHAYISDYVSGPSTHGGGEVEGPSYEDFPGVMEQVCAVIRATGWEPDAVWNLGVGEVEWYIAGVYRLRGVDMKIKTEHDEEFERGLRKMRAAQKAREEAERKEDEGSLAESQEDAPGG